MTVIAEGDDVNTVVRNAIKTVLLDGAAYVSGPSSMNAGKPIIEYLNSTIFLRNPRRRIFWSNVTPPLFNPALAAARLIYLLSGSNKLEPIEFYSTPVRRFSDDGLTISGSSYGHRIFAAEDSRNQFAECARLITSRSQTKRAVLSIYSASDTGRISKDIPCALSIVFIPRKKLDVVCIMRANDALKLLPYNLFEFTFLAECMAAHTGLELGDYHQFSVSLHLRGDGIALAQQVRNESVQDTGEMLTVQAFTEELRLELVEIERSIRKRRLRTKDLDIRLVGCDRVWLDIFNVLAMEADRRSGTPLQTVQQTCDLFVARNQPCVLANTYRRYLDLTADVDASLQ